MTWIPTPLMSGDEIYRNFQDGPGPEGLATSAELVNGLVGRYQERADRILRLRARMEAAWQGAAGDAANRGLGPLVIEHGLAGRALHVAQDLTSRQVGSFDEAKNAVEPVPPAPGDVDALAMLVDPEVASNHLRQVALYNQAVQHNVDVMNGYTGASQYNADRQPTSYGQLTGDLAGIGIDTGPSSETGGPSGESDVDVRTQDIPGPAATTSDSVGDGPPSGPGGTESGTGTVAESGSTRPPGADTTRPAGAEPTRPATTVPAGGLGIPVTGDAAPDSGPRGGGASGGGAGGGGVPPRGEGPAGGLIGGGRSVHPAQPGVAARPMVISAGPGRGGVGFAGLPPLAGSRGRGAEDTERTAPAYLDGGDPEELWGTDEPTTPPAIGDEDG